MSNFALNSTDPKEDIISSINYLLATNGVPYNQTSNTANALIANTTTGQITTTASASYISYLYPYLHVRYADNATGSSNFSTSPTNRLYYGVYNSTTTTGSSNPADYQWTQVVGGFSTTKFLFYQVFGGRQILFNVSTAVPALGYVQTVDATAINLDYITAVANVVITANNIVTSTITGNQIANNTVATTNITPNAISVFGTYQNNADLITFSPTANTFYSLTNTVTITTTVTNTKVMVTGQVTSSLFVNVATAGATITSNLGIRMFDFSNNLTTILSSEAVTFTFPSVANLQQVDHQYYETGVTLNLPNVTAYQFGVYGYYEKTGNATVYARDSINRRNSVQNLKR